MKPIVLILFIIAINFAHAADYIIKQSHYSVNKTVDRFKKAALEKGFQIFMIIDHQANAKKAGLKMHEQKVVIFGNPHGGTKLMNSNPKIGIELPLKVGIYKDQGKVKLIYKKPYYYEKTFGLNNHRVLKKLKTVLNKITNEAIN